MPMLIFQNWHCTCMILKDRSSECIGWISNGNRTFDGSTATWWVSLCQEHLGMWRQKTSSICFIRWAANWSDLERAAGVGHFSHPLNKELPDAS